MRSIILLLVVALSVSACRKKPDPVPPVTNSGGNSTDGHLNLEFEAKVGSSLLDFNNTTYLNANGDSFKVTIFKYYITNIRLTREDSTIYIQPESYHLINHSVAGANKIELHDVPAGRYKSVSFLIGVDSLRNVSGSQTGALDVLHAMFWGWNTGYIFAKLEGSYAIPGQQGSFYYHIGGFEGKSSALRWVTLSFPENAEVGDRTPDVHITSDISEWFKTPQTISFSEYISVMETGTPMTTLVNNYADMFSVSHVQN